MFTSSLLTALGGLITAFAPSLAVFLIGRVVTGVGAAGISSVSIILIVQLTSPKRRGLFIGMLNTGFTIGVATGAVAAGAIQPTMGWRALFWMQVPLALLAGSTLLIAIPASLSADDSQRYSSQSVLTKLASIDYIGAALLISTICLLLYGLSTQRITILPIILSLLLFPLFLYQEIYASPDPIIPVTVLGSRGAFLTCFATLGFMMARWSILFYTPVYAAAVRAWNPAQSGSLLIPTNLGFALGGLIPGAVHIRRAGSFWGSCLVVFALFPVTSGLLAYIATDTSPVWVVVLVVFANGLCAGAALNYTLAHVLHLVLPEVRFIVTSLLVTFRGFAGTFGSAIGGGVFARALKASLENGFEEHGMAGKKTLIRELLGSPRVVRQLSGIERAVAVRGYIEALRALWFSAVVLTCFMWFIQAGTGWSAPKTLAEEEDGYSNREDTRS
jgi:predicted MFS family arabinose efflux permease